MNYLDHESIHEAVSSSDIQRIIQILERNSSCVNNLDVNFDSPLHLIYAQVCPDDESQADDRLQIMKLLIEYGANVNAVNRCNDTPLQVAIMKNRIDGIRILLQNNADPDVQNNYRHTALITAVVYASIDVRKYGEIIKLLLEYKANPNKTDIFGNSALDMAFHFGGFVNAPFLLDSGMKFKNIYHTFMNVFYFDDDDKGTNKNYSDIIDFLWRYIEIAKDQLGEQDHFSVSNFGYCCEMHPNKKDERILAFLKSLQMQGFVINNRDSNLHIAVRRNNEMLVQALLENKDTNINAKNAYGEIPLHLIFEMVNESSEKIGQLLLQAGANWRTPNLFGKTSFYMAVHSQKVTLVDTMLRKIARLDDMMPLTYHLTNLPFLGLFITKNEAALHELQVAICVGCEPVIDRLLDEEYSEARKSCHENITIALVQAIELNECDIVKKLLEAGFRTNGNLFKSAGFKRDTTRLSCLLWEFGDRNSVFQLLCNALLDYSPTPDLNIFIDLVLFYYAIDEHINGSVANLIWLQASVQWKNLLAAKFAECKDDLIKMKTNKVGSVSAFDIMMLKLDSLVKLLNNPEFKDICTKTIQKIKNSSGLKYCFVALQYRLELALEKNETMNAALHFFNNIFEIHLTKTNFTSLPSNIGWVILSNLNMRDLKNFLTAVHKVK